jgi:hypothetical protein
MIVVVVVQIPSKWMPILVARPSWGESFGQTR